MGTTSVPLGGWCWWPLPGMLSSASSTAITPGERFSPEPAARGPWPPAAWACVAHLQEREEGHAYHPALLLVLREPRALSRECFSLHSCDGAVSRQWAASSLRRGWCPAVTGPGGGCAGDVGLPSQQLLLRSGRLPTCQTPSSSLVWGTEGPREDLRRRLLMHLPGS